MKLLNCVVQHQQIPRPIAGVTHQGHKGNVNKKQPSTGTFESPADLLDAHIAFCTVQAANRLL